MFGYIHANTKELTEENKNLLDVYLLGSRITQEQYEELMGLIN